MTAWCPRCTPSNAPMARKSGPSNCARPAVERKISIRKMTNDERGIRQNDEARMTNDEGMTKSECRKRSAIRHLSFGFVSSFSLRSPHSGNLRQRKHTRDNFGRLAIFDLIDRDRVRDIESPRFHSSERIEMGAATEFRANVVCVSSNIKTFATDNGEIHFG